MRLYGAINKIEPCDDGTVRVHGIASSEAVDDHGEVVRSDAMRAAIPDYMRFPALREMHQLSAAGTTLEAEVGDDGTTRIVAHVVDPVAVAKVKTQVYRGFSIGGQVTRRDSGNPKAITGLVLNEISLVDRPANPEAVFDCWKAHMPETEPFNAPLQIWACGVAEHHHLAKADAAKCLAKREAEPAPANATSHAAVSKVFSDGGRIEQLMTDLDWLKDMLDRDAAFEDGATTQSARLHILIAELCGFLGGLMDADRQSMARAAGRFTPGTSGAVGELAKVLADQHGESVALTKIVGQIVPMLEQLTKRVEDIARTPLPPLTIAKGTVSITKQQDRVGDPGLSTDAVAAALARMSKEEQTVALIKASYANPIRLPGTPAEEP